MATIAGVDDDDGVKRDGVAAGPQTSAPRTKWRLLAVRSALSVSTIALATAAYFVMTRRPPLPTYVALPPLALVDQNAAPLQNSTLAGRVQIVDFVFLRCTTSCPALTSKMKALGAKLFAKAHDHGGAQMPLHLLSISVDPSNDTPDQLAAYMQKAGIDSVHWTFATGDSEMVQKVVINGFKIGVARVPTEGGGFDIVHGNKFVLVDASLKIRGYYDAMDDSENERLQRDAFQLVDELRGSSR